MYSRFRLLAFVRAAKSLSTGWVAWAILFLCSLAGAALTQTAPTPSDDAASKRRAALPVPSAMSISRDTSAGQATNLLSLMSLPPIALSPPPSLKNVAAPANLLTRLLQDNLRVSLRPLETQRPATFAGVANSNSSPMADLKIGILGPTNTIHVEEGFALSVAVSNSGPVDAIGVVVTNHLPANATFLSAHSSQGTYTLIADGVIFDLGNVPVGSDAMTTIALKFSAPGTATNIAQVNSAASDPVIADNLSSLAITAINELPIISSIRDHETQVNSPTLPIPFTVADVETPVANLILLGASSNTNVVPHENLIFSGSGRNRNLIVIPSANVIGVSDITVTVLDSTGGEASTSFQINVLTPTLGKLRIELGSPVPQRPKIDHVERVGDLLKLAFTAEAGVAYEVEYFDSEEGSRWQRLTEVEASSEPTFWEISDPIGEHSQRFYRLRVNPAAQTQSAAAVPKSINLIFDAQPGISYTVEYKDSIVSGEWQVLTTVEPVADESTVVVSDFDNPQPQRFYRLRRP